MKVKTIALILLVLIFKGCAKNKYVDPIDEINTAVLTVDLVELLKNDNFPIDMSLELDNKVIDTSEYPSMDVTVLAGKHKIILEITAYYTHNNERRAKHNVTKEYVIDFKPNNTYIISAKVLKDKLTNIADNVDAIYSIQSQHLNIKEKIVLEDSVFRSFRPSSLTQKEATENIIDSVIQTVILPSL